MPQLIAWGNNVAGNLDAEIQEPYISTPTRVCESRSVKEIVWTSWTSTIIRDDKDTFYIRGTGSLIKDRRGPVPLDVSPADDAKIIGIDEPVAYLSKEGSIHSFGKAEDKEEIKGWKDVVVTGLGVVYGVSANGIYRFKTYANFVSHVEATEIKHPALELKHPISLYATESRVIALSKGPLEHLFELKEDQHGTVSVHLIEDLEGLGIQTVIAGSANRFGVITEAGDAYLIPKGSLEPELMELEDESAVRMIGVGSKFEVVVTDDNVWVRGESEPGKSLDNFSQLGMDGKEAREEFVRHPYFEAEMVKRIKSVHCARWSTIISMHDP